MPRNSHDSNDELVKAQRRQPERQANDPRADAPRDPATLLSALGNARVQRLMRAAAIRRSADGSGTVDEAVARAIQSKRGGGAPLADTERRTMESNFGEDFSDVRVHTDGEADSLNHAVRAEAFTTGKDIFFRGGAYNPGSSDGQKLLAHELTHVVQQGNAPPASGLTVSSPDDASEREAGHVADSFDATAATAEVSRQELPEEEEEVAMSRLDRQVPEEEEEMLQGSFIDRQMEEEEEEEMAMSRLDRQTAEEEEELPQV
ncbi:MAG: DUF4157 domain-containing protein [Dehalococcoidia bacterium]|nr:DUF4157 domain-containing protein [Dehalococcoidia bacterium]